MSEEELKEFNDIQLSAFLTKEEILKAYRKLQQEKQQLKEKLDNNTKIYLNTSKYASECEGKMVTYKYERDKYKEVIEEVREYIDNNSHYFAIDGSSPGFVIDKEEQAFCEELLQILDKVKGE